MHEITHLTCFEHSVNIMLTILREYLLLGMKTILNTKMTCMITVIPSLHKLCHLKWVKCIALK